MKSILTKEEVADLLRVSQRTIDNLRQKGLPCFNVGRSIRFAEDDITAWLRSQSSNDAVGVTLKGTGDNEVSLN